MDMYTAHKVNILSSYLYIMHALAITKKIHSLYILSHRAHGTLEEVHPGLWVAWILCAHHQNVAVSLLDEVAAEDCCQGDGVHRALENHSHSALLFGYIIRYYKAGIYLV